MTPKGLTRWLIQPTTPLPVCPATRKTNQAQGPANELSGPFAAMADTPLHYPPGVAVTTSLPLASLPTLISTIVPPGPRRYRWSVMTSVSICSPHVTNPPG